MGLHKIYTEEQLRENRRISVRISQKRRREIAKASGFCSICCHNKAREGLVTCQECNDRALESYHRRHGGK